MKIFLFGAGRYYQRYKKWFSKEQVIGILDNDKNKIGTYLDNLPVMHPSECPKLVFDRIYILSLHINVISKQLQNIGISEHKIYSYHDIYRTVDYPILERKYYKSFSSKESYSICLISHNFSLSGAPIALYNLGLVLQKNNYSVTVASPDDGPLRKRYTEKGISVVIDPNLEIVTLKDTPFLQEYKVLILNTTTMWHLLNNYNDSKPIVWWIHESKMLYRDGDLCNLPSKQIPKVRVYAVSDIAKKSFWERLPYWNVNSLPVGIGDNSKKIIPKNKTHKIIFALIGNYCKRKAQDVFLSAIEMLSLIERSNCEFWLIGKSENDAYSRTIIGKSSKMADVRVLGELTNDRVIELFSEISILACPSLEETCSLVVVEAMMCSVPSIVTETTGISQYVTQNKNGIICQAGNVENLAESMRWVIEHSKYLPMMGRYARLLYERFFSYSRLEKNAIKMIRDVLQK